MTNSQSRSSLNDPLIAGLRDRVAQGEVQRERGQFHRNDQPGHAEDGPGEHAVAQEQEFFEKPAGDGGPRAPDAVFAAWREREGVERLAAELAADQRAGEVMGEFVRGAAEDGQGRERDEIAPTQSNLHPGSYAAAGPAFQRRASA